MSEVAPNGLLPMPATHHTRFAVRPLPAFQLQRSRHTLINFPLPSNNIPHPSYRIAIRPCNNQTGGRMTNPIPMPIPNPQPPIPNPVPPCSHDRANRANSALSTGSRAAAHQQHCRQFFDEYQPATPTETHLTQELADTAWRLNRIPPLEAALLDRAANPPSDQAAIDFDIVDAHRAVATLGMHSQRLSRQFQKSLDTLRELQSHRAERQHRELKDAAALLEFHKHKGTPWQPADHGFVFSKDHVERFTQHIKDLNAARHIEYVRLYMPPSRRGPPARPSLS
jgi:hypothetical protein